MGISLNTSGSFEKVVARLQTMSKSNVAGVLNRYGAMGTAALRAATPIETGVTANAWTHKVQREGPVWTLSWHNQNGSTGKPIAIMLQYGHGTGTGGYVAGRDYINPALSPVFDQIVAGLKREVSS